MSSPELSEWTTRIRQFQGLLSILGNSKNAGKTTVLNYLLRKLDADRLAVTSIGRDGESVDVLQRHPKPAIQLAKGALFVTAEQCLERSQGAWTVLQSTRHATPLGRILALRAKSDSRVELAGPSGVEQLVELARRLRSLGASCILVDGAFDRSAAASAQLCDGLILALGCDGKSGPADAIEEWSAWLQRFRLPAAATARPSVRLKALTADQLPGLRGQTVLLPDPSCCLVEPSQWKWIESGQVRVVVERPISLEGVFLSSFRAFSQPLPAPQLLSRMRKRHPAEQIFDLRLEGELSRPGRD